MPLSTVTYCCGHVFLSDCEKGAIVPDLLWGIDFEKNHAKLNASKTYSLRTYIGIPLLRMHTVPFIY